MQRVAQREPLGGCLISMHLAAHLTQAFSLDPSVCRGKSAAMFTAAAAVYWAAVVLDAEPLLACVTAGLVVANRRWSPFLQMTAILK